MTNEQQKDEALWQIAKKRAAFKKHLVSYFLVNCLLIAIWMLGSYKSAEMNYFWPIWPILGWGIGLGFSYADAYHTNNLFSTEKEYEKLKKDE